MPGLEIIPPHANVTIDSEETKTYGFTLRELGHVSDISIWYGTPPPGITAAILGFTPNGSAFTLSLTAAQDFVPGTFEISAVGTNTPHVATASVTVSAVPSAIIYITIVDVDSNPLPNLNPTFSPSVPFVSVNGQGNPPQRAAAGSATWLMGVKQGTVITVSAPLFLAAVVDTFAPGVPFVGTNEGAPIEVAMVPADIWTWTSPTPLAVNTSPAPGVEATGAWKVAYAVGGVLRNDETSALNAELAVTQTGPWTAAPGGPSAIVATQNATVPAGSSIPVSFGLFTQSWQWFEQATGALTGPTTQFITYSLAATLTDGSGSQFNIAPSDLIVQVSVASYKQTDDTLAITFFSASATLAAAAAAAWLIPPLAAALAAASFAAQIAAQGESAAANDPPEPSLAYDRVESFQPPAINAATAAVIPNIIGLLARALRLTEVQRVLSITEGRLEGARRAGTQDDVSRQLGHYSRVAAIAISDRKSVEASGAAADQEFTEVLDRLLAETARDSNNGSDSPTSITPAGMTGQLTRLLQTLGNHPEIAGEVRQDILTRLSEESSGTFAELASRLGEAIDHIASHNRRLVQTAFRAAD